MDPTPNKYSELYNDQVVHMPTYNYYGACYYAEGLHSNYELVKIKITSHIIQL